MNDNLATPGAYPAGVVAAKNISSTIGTAGTLGAGQIAVRVGQTVFISFNNGAGVNRGVVTNVGAGGATQFTVALYEAGGLAAAGTGLPNADCTIFRLWF